MRKAFFIINALIVLTLTGYLGLAVLASFLGHQDFRVIQVAHELLQQWMGAQYPDSYLFVAMLALFFTVLFLGWQWLALIRSTRPVRRDR